MDVGPISEDTIHKEDTYIFHLLFFLHVNEPLAEEAGGNRTAD